MDRTWSELSEHDRRCGLLELDEDDVDEWTVDDPRVRGCSPYLLDARQRAVGSTGPMRGGVLRSDAVRRRMPGRMNAGRRPD